MARRKWDVEELVVRWQDWKIRPFPKPAYDIEFEDIDLVLLDTYAVGCISTFVESRGRLDIDSIRTLQSCTADLETVLDKLNGETREYFTELAEISHKVLKAL